MIQARRLLAVGAILGVAAIVTCSTVWGGPGLFRDLRTWHKGDGKIIKPEDSKSTFADDLNRNRFVGVHVTERGAGAVVQCDLRENGGGPLLIDVLDGTAGRYEGEAQRLIQKLVRALEGVRPSPLNTISVA